MISTVIAEKLVVIGFIFFVFFPYIQFFPTVTDVQPYALIFSIFIMLLLVPKKLPLEIWIFFLVMFFSILLLLPFGLTMESVRSVSNYMSLFFISGSSYYLFKYKKISLDFIGWVVGGWFFVGFVQRFFVSDFMTFVLPRAKGIMRGGRGVVGLAPEPTFYGIFCIFILLILFSCRIKHRKTLIVLTLIQMVIFSMSATSILFLIIFILYYLAVFFPYDIFLRGKTPKIYIVALFVVLAMIALFPVGLQQLQTTRIFKLSGLFLSSPLEILMLDASANERLINIASSFMGFISNCGLPGGYNTFHVYLADYIIAMKDYVVMAHISDRIMSAYGSVLYELGVVGMFIPVAITLAIFRKFREKTKQVVLYGLFINTILLSAMPLSFPLLGFLIGYFSSEVIPRNSKEQGG